MRGETDQSTKVIVKVNEKEVCYPNQVSLDTVIDDLDCKSTFLIVFVNDRMMVNRDWSEIRLKTGDVVYVDAVWITGG